MQFDVRKASGLSISSNVLVMGSDMVFRSLLSIGFMFIKSGFGTITDLHSKAGKYYSDNRGRKLPDNLYVDWVLLRLTKLEVELDELSGLVSSPNEVKPPVTTYIPRFILRMCL